MLSVLVFHPQHAHPKNLLRKDRVSPVSWAFALPAASAKASLYSPDPFPQQPLATGLAPQFQGNGESLLSTYLVPSTHSAHLAS